MLLPKVMTISKMLSAAFKPPFQFNYVHRFVCPRKECHARSRHVTYTLIETLVSEVCMLHALSMHASRYTRKMNFMM